MGQRDIFFLQPVGQGVRLTMRPRSSRQRTGKQCAKAWGSGSGGTRGPWGRARGVPGEANCSAQLEDRPLPGKVKLEGHRRVTVPALLPPSLPRTVTPLPPQAGHLRGDKTEHFLSLPVRGPLRWGEIRPPPGIRAVPEERAVLSGVLRPESDRAGYTPQPRKDRTQSRAIWLTCVPLVSACHQKPDSVRPEWSQLSGN